MTKEKASESVDNLPAAVGSSEHPVEEAVACSRLDLLSGRGIVAEGERVLELGVDRGCLDMYNRGAPVRVVALDDGL